MPWDEEEVATICSPIKALGNLGDGAKLGVTIADLKDIVASTQALKLEEGDEDQIFAPDNVDMEVPGAHEFIVETLKEERSVEPEGDLFTVQGDMSKHFKMQEIGLDVGFKCLDCKICKKGAGSEKQSIMQDKEQVLVRDSVEINLEAGRAEAVLPLKQDPDVHLVNNRPSALKRLENVL